MRIAIDIVGDRSRCDVDCARFVDHWRPWWERQLRRPMALLRATSDYGAQLDVKARNMRRSAERRYRFTEIDRNEHLEGIYRVNTSKPVRSGGPMRPHYLERPVATTTIDRTCSRHGSVWHGGFDRDDDSLVAYAQLVLLSDLAVINTILGSPVPGCVNGLISHLVAFCVERDVPWLHYLTLSSSPHGLARFKMSVGFREVSVR